MKKDKKVKNRKINSKLIIRAELLILAVFFVIGIFQIYTYVPGVKAAVTLATTKQPETFTELYFENHLNLPKTIEQNKEYSFSFTVHNLEFKDFEYPYIVYLQRDNEKIILDGGNFTLKQDQFKTIKEDFGPLKNQRAKIVVEITNKNQQIALWMEEQ